MKILWISPLPSLPASNMERCWQVSFGHQLMTGGHEIFFIYCGPEIDIGDFQRMKRLYTRFVYVPAYSPSSPQPVDLERLGNALKLFADKYEYFVCSCWFMAPLFASVHDGLIKILIPCSQNIGSNHDFLFYKQQELLRNKKLKYLIFCGADIIVAASEAEKKFLVKTGVRVPIIIYQNVVNEKNSEIQNICAILKRKKKMILIVIDYPFWMVRYGGHAPGFLVMANYIKRHYSLDIFFHGNFKEWEMEQATKLGLGANIYPAADYQDDNWQVDEPDEQDFLPPPMRHHYKDYHYKAFAKFLANRPKYDAIIVFTIFNSWFIKGLPYNTLTVLDTHDFWSLRNYIYEGKEETLLFASQEINIFNRYDATVFVEESEMSHAQQIMPQTISICCPFTYPAPPLPFPSSGLHFGFIAPAHIFDPIKWFMDEVWVFQDRPDARLHIFGTVCELIKNPPFNVILHGIVQSEEKIHSYCNIMLNPAFIATGISTKTVMALAYGRPVLATSVGARGITGTTGHGIYVANSRNDFINGMQLFSHDKGMLEKFSKDALEFSRNVFTVDHAYEPLAKLIESY